MSKFFVGLRVRVIAVNIPEAAYLVGAECRIVGTFQPDGFYPEAWELDRDSFCVQKDVADKYLVPIQPEGTQPSTYSFKELMDECREGVAV